MYKISNMLTNNYIVILCLYLFSTINVNLSEHIATLLQDDPKYLIWCTRLAIGKITHVCQNV